MHLCKTCWNSLRGGVKLCVCFDEERRPTEMDMHFGDQNDQDVDNVEDAADDPLVEDESDDWTGSDGASVLSEYRDVSYNDGYSECKSDEELYWASEDEEAFWNDDRCGSSSDANSSWRSQDDEECGRDHEEYGSSDDEFRGDEEGYWIDCEASLSDDETSLSNNEISLSDDDSDCPWHISSEGGSLS